MSLVDGQNKGVVDPTSTYQTTPYTFKHFNGDLSEFRT